MMGKHSYIANPVPQAACMTGTLNIIEGPRMSVESPPSTSVYPDLAPYSSQATSFTLPAQCDSSLLTPNSTAGSPLLLPGSDFRPQYHSPGTPHKELTPPDSSSNMYPFHNQFEMNSQTSQTGSPMTHHTSTSGEYGEAYVVTDGRRTPNPPSEAYMGTFGVSEGAQPHGLQAQGAPFYMMQHPQHMQHPGHLMRDDHPIPLDVPRNMDRQLPLHYHQIKSESRDNDDALSFSRGSDAVESPRSRHTRTTNRIRHKRGAASRKSVPSRALLQEGDPVEEHQNWRREENPPGIKSTCPAEERCIFESRWRHRHQKGQDMWNSISRDYAKIFGAKSSQKEKLQMKYTRGRPKYYEWDAEDEEKLRRAWMHIETERYQAILEKFVSLGGSRNMNLSPADIETKLTSDLKLDEDVYVSPLPEVNVRRRRKLNRTIARAFEDTNMSQGIQGVTFQNTRREDEIIHQIQMQQSWDQGSTMTPESIDIQMSEGRPIKLEPGVATRSRGAFNKRN